MKCKRCFGTGKEFLYSPGYGGSLSARLGGIGNKCPDCKGLKYIGGLKLKDE